MRATRLFLLGSIVLSNTTCRPDELVGPQPEVELIVSPNNVSDSAAMGSKALVATLHVTNTGGGSLSWQATRVTGATWLSLSATSGTAPAIVTVSLDPEGLAVGTYRDTVEFAPEPVVGPPIRVPFELRIHPCAVTVLADQVALGDSLTTADCSVARRANRSSAFYSFTGSTGDSVSITLVSTGFQGVLAIDTVMGGTPLVERVCDGTPGHPCLRNILLPRSGTFYVEVTSSAPARGGTFSLSIATPHAPPSPAELNQFTADSVTVIGLGAAVGDTIVVFKGKVFDSDSGDVLRLEIEVKPHGVPFGGSPTDSTSRDSIKSVGVASGETVALPVMELSDDTGYHWRARTSDETGRTSAWVNFGANPDTAVDFRIAVQDAPGTPSQLHQFKSDLTTALALGSSTDEQTVVFSGVVTDGDPQDLVRLEIEVQQVGTAFDGTASGVSVPVASGVAADASVSGLGEDADYHWRARTLDQAGNASAWVTFGANGEDETDFSVAVPQAPNVPTDLAQLPPVTTGLVASWPMNEGSGTTTADASGNGHTGTLVNNATWTPGPGLTFDGVNDYVNVGTFDVPGSALTLAAWIRSDQLDNCSPGFNECRIISKATGSSAQDHYFMLSTITTDGGATTKLRFRLKTGGNTTTLIASSGDLANNQWTHAAAVYDGATMRLYLNGVEVGATAESGNISTNSSVPVWIGSNPTNPTVQPWDGQIDDVRVYDRALSAQELLALTQGNQAPVAIAATVVTDEDVAVAITLQAADADGDALSYSVTAGPTHGVLTGTAPILTYTPNADFNGADSLGFLVDDGQGGTDTATISITITPVADPPVAVAATVVTDEDVAVAITLQASDADGDTLSYTVTTPPTHGVLTGTAPTLTYTPDTGFIGADSLDFLVDDGQGGTDTATISITVNLPNVAPVANDDTATTEEDVAVAITLQASDANGDTLSYTVTTQPTHGVLTGTAPNLTYTPNADFNGSDSLAFLVNDGKGGTDTATISITITPVADPPVAVAATVVTDEDVAVAITLQAADADGDALSYSVTAGPTNGVLTGTAPNLTYTPNTDFNGSDSFDFRVDDGKGGTDTATISITVNPVTTGLVASWPMNEGSGTTTADASGNGHTGTLVNDPAWIPGPGLTFDGVNDYVNVGTFDVPGSALTLAAWIRSDQLDNCSPGFNECRIISKATGSSSQDHYFMLSTITTDGGATTKLRFRLKTGGNTTTLIASSGDLANNQWTHAAAVYDGATMRLYLNGVEVGATAESGNISTNSSVPVWIGSNPPNPTVQPWDGQIDDVRVYDRALSAQELLALTQGNQVPVATAATVVTDEDVAVAITLQASDADGDALSYTVTTQPTHGVLTGTAPTLTYTPNADVNGADSLAFLVDDGQGGTDTATISITITPLADPPVATAAAVETDADVAVAITLQASDADGDTLSYTVTTQPTHGVLTGMAPNLTYTPDTGFTGADSLDFLVDDGQGGTDTATISITVNLPNVAPVATDDTVVTNEDVAVAITLQASDANGDTLSYTVTTQPTHGVLTGTAPNLTYTPNADVNGADSLAFLVDDGQGGTDTATISITVTPVADPPVAAAATVVTDEDVAVAITLQASDADGDALSYSVTAGPTHGVLTGTAPDLTYTPNADVNGADSLDFLVDDGQGGTDTATISITITPVADPPVAAAATVVTDEDVAVAITLQASDADGDALSYSVTAGPTHGVLTGTAPNLTYTPNADVNGADSLAFLVDDGQGGTDTATISITITPVADPPVAAAATVVTNEDVAVAITLQASDADGDTLSYSVTAGPTHGVLTGTAPNLTYTPDTGFIGADSLDFLVDDGQGGTATATISITVNLPNVAPVATDDTATTNEDVAVAITLQASDANGDTLSYTVTTPPTHGVLTGTAPNLTYTPNADVNGADSLAFLVDDGQGGTDTATISITITPVADPPVAAAATVVTDEDVAVAITLQASDADGDALSYSVTAGPTHGVLTGTAPDLTYTPNADVNGADSLAFLVDDGQGGTDTATISITITPVADPPVATDDTVVTDEDVAVAITLQASDADGDTLSYTVTTQPTHGVLTGMAPNLTYTPSADVNDADSLAFLVDDGQGGTDTATISITITPVADPPVAAAAAVETDEDVAVAITLQASDADGDALSYTVTTQPTHGVLTGTAPNLTYTPDTGFTGSDSLAFLVDDGQGGTDTATISITVNPVATGLVGYWPMNEGSGTTTADASGNGHTGTLVNGPTWLPGPGLTLDGVNDYVDVGTFDVAGSALTLAAWIRSAQLDNCSPGYNECRIISKATGSSAQDHYFMLSTFATDGGATTKLRFRLKTGGNTTTLIASSGALANNQWAHAAAVYDGATMRLYLNGVEVGATAESGNISTNSSVPVWIGSNPPNPTVQPWDGQIDDVRVYDRALSAQELLALTQGNQAPVATAATVVTDEDVAVAITLQASDADGDALSYTVTTQPTHGVLTGTAPTLTYTPNAGFNGADSLGFQVNDGKGGTDTATISITVNLPNVAPVANDDTATTNEDVAVAITLQASDANGDTLSYTVTTPPTHGVLTGTAPTLTYTPNADFNGADSLGFQVNDGKGGTDTATISITITPVADPPVAVAATVVTDEDVAVAITLQAADADGDTLSYTVTTPPTHGVLSGTAPTLTYTPNADFNGADSLGFLVNDGQGGTDTATISITITPVADPPVAVAATVVTDEDVAVAITLQAADADGDTLSYTVTTPPTHGVLTGTAPTLTYTPNADFNGADSLGFLVNDGQGGTATATISITITPVADPPVAVAATVVTDEDVAVAITLQASDADGDTLSYTVTTQPTHGVLTGMAPNLTYAPSADFNGADSLAFLVDDGQGGTDTATISITITPVADPPVATAAAVETDEDVAVAITLQASDADGDTLSYSVTVGPTHGVLTGTAPNLTYTPNADVTGSDSFAFLVDDGQGGTDTATISITVNPVVVPTVTLTVDSTTLAEDDTANLATVTATLSEASSQAVTVDLGFTGTATVTDDYTRSGVQIVIPALATTGTVTIAAVDDGIDEPNETVVVDIDAVSGAVEVGTQQVTVTITDHAVPTVTLTVDSTTLAEDGTANLATVTATVSEASSQAVTVDLGFTGTATVTDDYTRSGVQIVIPALATTGTVTIAAVDDGIDEPDETVVVDIDAVSGAVEAGTQQVTVTLVDDEATPTVTLMVDSTTLAEDGTANPATVTATLSGASSQAVTVDLGFTGTATVTDDYTRSGVQIVIPALAMTGTVTIAAVDDGIDEPDETVIVDITGVSGATEAGTQQVTVTLVDDEATPTVTLTVDSTTLAEDDTANPATVTATLSGASSQAVTVDLGFTGTATVTDDYTRSGVQIVIPALATTGTVTIAAVDDGIDEPDETVVVDIDAVSGAVEAGTQQVTVTLMDDDAVPTVTLTVDSTTLAEDDTANPATVTATLSGPSSQAVAVDLGFTGTATVTDDYTRSGVQIVIPALATTGTVTIAAVDDGIDEPDETVVVDIVAVSGATEAGTQQVTVTITDHAVPTVTLMVDNTTLAEDGTANPATVTATLSEASSQAVTVDLGFTGTATVTDDYTRSGVQIVIPALATTGTVTIAAVDDGIDEPDETVVVDIDAVSGAVEAGTQQVTVTLTDDDAEPTVTLGVDKATLAEDGTANPATVTATLSGPSGHAVAVDLGFTGTATVTDDYERSGVQIVIRALATTGTVTVYAVPDAIDEPDETVIVDIDAVSGATEVGTQQVTVTLVDDEATPTVTLTVDSTTLAEDDTPNLATVTATLAGPSSQAVAVDLGFTGTATVTDDYTRSGVQIVIPALATTGTVTIAAVDDGIDEPDETVVVDITGVSGAVEVGTQQVTVTITDHAVPTVTLTVDRATLAEDGTANPATVTATLSGASSQAVTVELGFTGTATVTDDYTRSAGQIVIPALATTGTLTVNAVPDVIDEPNETVIVDITGVSAGATEAGTQQVTVTLTDDDAEPTVTLTVDQPTLAEDGTANPATVTATLSGPSSQAVTVDLGFTGAATLTEDYTRSGVQIVIPALATTGTVTVNAVPDAIDEPDESVVVDIIGVSGATETGTQQVTVTLTDDDVTPTVTLTVDQATLAEDGTANLATGTATLSGASSQAVTVELGFTGAATLTEDYVRSGTQIVIPALATTGTVTIAAVDDAIDEPDETVIVDIIGVGGGATEAGTQQVTVTITDDDATPTVTLTVDRATLAEDGTANPATVTATLSGASSQAVTVDLGFTGTATVTDDYTRSAGQIVIPALATMGTVTIAAVDDGIDEPDETVIVDITGVSAGAAEAGTQQVTVTITDHVVPTVTLTVDRTTLAEDGTANPATVTATLSGASSQAVTVDLGFTGTATKTDDYTRSAVQIVIPALATTGTVTIAAVDDGIDEPDESVVVDIIGVRGATETGTQQVTVTLTDDDAEPTVTLSVDKTTLAEAGTENPATITATLSGASSLAVAVDLAFTGTATLTDDYTRSGVQIVVPALATTGTVTIAAVDDAIDEPDESVVVDIIGVGGGAAESGTQQVTVTVKDDEATFHHVPLSGPANVHSKDVGDINGDGFLDLVVAGTGGEIFWYEFPSWTRHEVTSGGGGWSTDVEVADINGDGRNDLVVSDWYGSNRIGWYENPGPAGSWTMHWIGSPRAHDIEVADLDRDGDQDIVTRQQRGPGATIELWEQQTPIAWSRTTLTNVPAGEGLHLGDLDQDGDADIVIGVYWYENDGSISGSWTRTAYGTSWGHESPGWNAATNAFVGDIDGDGDQDIVLTPSEGAGDSHRTAWFENPGNPRTSDWAEHVIDPDIEAVTHSLGVADIDRDGLLDVITAEMDQGADPDEVRIYYNRGSGLSWEKEVVATTGSHNLRVADIGNDGDFDLFGTNHSVSGAADLWINGLDPAGIPQP